MYLRLHPELQHVEEHLHVPLRLCTKRPITPNVSCHSKPKSKQASKHASTAPA